MTKLMDVAKAAGFSLSTASRALNNDPRISDETKEIVSKAAEDLNYFKKGHKNGDQRKNHIGIIVPELMCGYYSKLLQIISNELRPRNYDLLIKLDNYDRELRTEQIENFGDTDIKGLIVVIDDSEEVTPSVIDAVEKPKIPVFFITAQYYQSLKYDNIFVDEHSGIITGVDHLVKRGYKKIAYIGDQKTNSRLDVFRKAMQDYGFEVYEDLIVVSDDRGEKAGYEAMNLLLDRGKKFEAVFTSYDQIAIGAILAAEERSLRIPEDLAVMGYDDIDSAKCIKRGLTTISNPYDDVVSIMLRVLLDRINGSNSVPQQIAVASSLIIRHTT